MKLETRIENIKSYLAEALQSPEGNELYIEDLKLSLDIFQKAVNNKSEIVVMNGFTIDSQNKPYKLALSMEIEK